MVGGGSYLDLDDILMEQESVPVTFKITVPHKGHLIVGHSGGIAGATHVGGASGPGGAGQGSSTINAGSSSSSSSSSSSRYKDSDIALGTKANLPFWLVEVLFSENLVELHAPRIFSAPVLRSLRASASRVDLHSLSPYYFLVARKLISITDDVKTAQDFANVMTAAFKERLRVVLEHTQTSLEEHTSEFIQGLDVTEREILKLGQESHAQLRSWSRRASNRITAAPSLSLMAAGRASGSGGSAAASSSRG